MRTITYVIASGLVFAVIALLPLPYAVFASLRDAGVLLLLLAGAILAFAVTCVSIGLRQLRKRTKETALASVSAGGVVAWVVLNWQALKLAERADGRVWTLVGLATPIIICVILTAFIRKAVEREYKKTPSQASQRAHKATRLG